MTDEIADVKAEADALIDHGIIAAAEAVLATALRRAIAALQRAEEADAAVHQARAALPDLIDRVAGGEEIEPAEIVSAHRAAADAETFSTFASAVARRAEGMAADVRDRLADAKNRACQPVLQRAIDLYILAGQKADRAILRTRSDTDTPPAEAERRQEVRRAAMSEGRAVFDRANSLLDLAARHGLRIPRHSGLAIPEWPVSERHMRTYWRRPYGAEEADAA